MNSCVMVGRLTKDIDFKVNGENMTAKFTIAVNRDFKNKNGQYDADFINCTAFGKRAETISKYFTKGQQVCVKGPWRTGSYNAQDGTKRYTNELLVEGFTFIGGQSNGNNSSYGENNVSNNNDFGYEEPIYNDDLPF